jgi:NTP pyrophosphatase (non-canonical NTP hydrolase)
MSETNWKHWLLRHERALQALAGNPDRSLRSIEKIYDVKEGEMQAFLDAHNAGSPRFETATIHAWKVRLGILSESGATPSPRPTVENPPPVRFARRKEAAADERPPQRHVSETGIAAQRPAWEGRKWRRDGFKRWRRALSKLQQDPTRALKEVAGDKRAGQLLSQFLRNWFGATPRTSELYAAFIAYGDAQAGGDKVSAQAGSLIGSPAAESTPASIEVRDSSPNKRRRGRPPGRKNKVRRSLVRAEAKPKVRRGRKPARKAKVNGHKPAWAPSTPIVPAGPAGRKLRENLVRMLTPANGSASAGVGATPVALDVLGAPEPAITLAALADVCRRRWAEWMGTVPNLRALLFCSNELGGEAGEACNVVKKIERGQMGVRGGIDLEAGKAKLGDELADVVICAQNVALMAGVNLEEALRRKFNATSDKFGLSTRIQGGAA